MRHSISICLGHAMAEPTVLFHVSDVHFGVEYKPAHDWFADAVARERPHAVICTGDVTQRARKREFEAARLWFQSFNVPMTIEPGNHDMPYYNLIERFRTPYKRFDALEKAVEAELMLPGVVIVPLRTTVRAQTRFPWSDGVVRSKALDLTLAELDRLSGDGRLKIIACHHPLMEGPAGSPNRTINGEKAFRALAEAGADVVLSGHVHNSFDAAHDVAGRKLRMIGAGTLSSRLRSTPPSYNVLRYDSAGGLTVEHREFITA